MTDAGIEDDISFLTKGSSGRQEDIVLIDAKANSNSVLKVMGNGNVGIGNSSPTNKLDVDGAVNASQYKANGVLLGQWMSSGNNIYYTGGYVGIGVTNPVNPLEVCGAIRAKEIIVDFTSWCDFVYDENYQLQQFQERMKEIKEKKRMPNMLSEKEVTKNGVPMLKSFLGLFRNVEELYLYMDWIEKRATAAEAKYAELEKKYKEMDARIKALENK